MNYRVASLLKRSYRRKKKKKQRERVYYIDNVIKIERERERETKERNKKEGIMRELERERNWS